MKYRDLIIYVFFAFVFFIIGLLSQFFKIGDDYWKIVTILDSATSVALAVLAFLAYKDFIKQEDDISFEFEIRDNKNIEKIIKKISFFEYLGYDLKIKRRQVNRAEVIGILGIIKPESTKRYNYNEKLLKDLMKNLLEVADGKRDIVTIPMLQQDFDTYFNKEK